MNITGLHAWTDSHVVLLWLTTLQTQFKVLITNRLDKIAKLITLCQWHYVKSSLNPADCVTRGLFPSEAISHVLYWSEPSFSMLPEHNWEDKGFEPISPSSSILPDLKEVIPSV